MSASKPVLFDSSSTNLDISDDVVFYNAAAVEEGDWVVIDRAETTYGLGAACKVAPASGADTQEVLGVALHDSAAGEKVRVRKYGPCTAKTTSATAGTGQQISATAGTSTDTGGNTQFIVGVALSATSSGTSTVFVKCG
jgi:predicted RecA/RadA family phage recombinase